MKFLLLSGVLLGLLGAILLTVHHAAPVRGVQYIITATLDNSAAEEVEAERQVREKHRTAFLGSCLGYAGFTVGLFLLIAGMYRRTKQGLPGTARLGLLAGAAALVIAGGAAAGANLYGRRLFQQLATSGTGNADALLAWPSWHFALPSFAALLAVLLIGAAGMACLKPAQPGEHRASPVLGLVFILFIVALVVSLQFYLVAVMTGGLASLQATEMQGMGKPELLARQISRLLSMGLLSSVFLLGAGLLAIVLGALSPAADRA